MDKSWLVTSVNGGNPMLFATKDEAINQAKQRLTTQPGMLEARIYQCEAVVKRDPPPMTVYSVR